MTLSSRHRIRNSSPGGLRPSTLLLGHGGSPQYWLSHVDGEETIFVSFKPPSPGTEPRTLAWKAAVLTTTLGDDINCVYYGIYIQSIIDYCITVWGSAAQKYLCEIQKLQNRAARLLGQNFDRNIRGIDIVRCLGWQNIKERYCFLSCCLTYKSLKNLGLGWHILYVTIITWHQPFQCVSRQNLTFTDVRFWRIKTVPALKELKHL